MRVISLGFLTCELLPGFLQQMLTGYKVSDKSEEAVASRSDRGRKVGSCRKENNQVGFWKGKNIVTRQELCIECGEGGKEFAQVSSKRASRRELATCRDCINDSKRQQNIARKQP